MGVADRIEGRPTGARRARGPRPRRVALVCPYSWSWPGGVQSHVAGLATALRSLDVGVDILAPADSEDASRDVIPLGRSVPVRTNGSVQRVALAPSAVVRTARLVRSGRYDLVHLHEPMIPSVCFVSLVAARLPLVGTFHMVGSSRHWYRTFAPLCRAAVARLRVRIAVSEVARRYVSSVCSGTYVHVPNGVHVPAARREHRGPGRTVVFVGRAEPRKGLPVLLEALRRLPTTVRLELVGVGAREVETLCHGDTRLRSRITAHGYLSDEARTERLLAADILCAPSLGGESFGLVLAEAMAVGVPVVASAVGGYRELVTDGCGRLVPPGDPVALAASLQELLSSAALRRRVAATGRARALELEWGRIAGRVLDLYRCALLAS